MSTAVTTDRSFFGHPKGLGLLFTTEMWERFSYYGLRPLLVLFMAAALNEGGFGLERTQASADGERRPAAVRPDAGDRRWDAGGDGVD